jgi:hypothetical protein
VPMGSSCFPYGSNDVGAITGMGSACTGTLRLMGLWTQEVRALAHRSQASTPGRLGQRSFWVWHLSQASRRGSLLSSVMMVGDCS